MTKAIPVTIRGTEYPSQRAAARALGVGMGTVCKAIAAGRLDTVGLGRPGGNPPNLERREQVRKLHAKGLWVAEIARRLDTYPATVSKALKRLGLTPNPKRRPSKRCDKADAVPAAPAPAPVSALDAMRAMAEQENKAMRRMMRPGW